MGERVVNTFGKLKGVLESLDFRAVIQPGRVIFLDPSGRPLILLPRYKNGQAVRPIHLMMVKKQLADVGMIDPDDFSLRMQRYRVAPSRGKAEARLAKKS